MKKSKQLEVSELVDGIDLISNLEEKYGSVSMLKIYSAAMRELIVEKQFFTRDEIDQKFTQLAIEADNELREENLKANPMGVVNLSPCNHDEGFDLNGVGMWICKTCRADITPEQNEQSSKDKDTSRVMTEDSEFNSSAAHRYLSHLITVLDKYGHGSSMMHPRLTIAIYNAKQYLKSTTL